MLSSPAPQAALPERAMNRPVPLLRGHSEGWPTRSNAALGRTTHRRLQVHTSQDAQATAEESQKMLDHLEEELPSRSREATLTKQKESGS